MRIAFILVVLGVMGLHVPYSHAASLRVFSNESDGKIYINDSYLGLTSDDQRNPVLIQDLRPGSYEIRVLKEGFAPFERKVNIQEGVPNSIEAILRQAATTGNLRVVFRYSGDISVGKLFKASADAGGSSCAWMILYGDRVYPYGDASGYWNGWRYRIEDVRTCVYERKDLSPGVHSFGVMYLYGEHNNMAEVDRLRNEGAQRDSTSMLSKALRLLRDQGSYDKISRESLSYKVEIFAGKLVTVDVEFGQYGHQITEEVGLITD